MRYCFARGCSNNSKKNPEKYFFHPPSNKILRGKWLNVVNRSTDCLRRKTYFCSDHFDLDIDLDRFASSAGDPKLERGTVPSELSKAEDILRRNAKIMKEVDIFGTAKTSPENPHFREVVYIVEENQSDRFLEENELEDTSSIEPENETKIETAKTAEKGVMYFDRNLFESASTSVAPAPTPIQNQIVRYKSKELNDVPKKPLILRHIKQMNSVDKRNSNPLPIAPKVPENDPPSKLTFRVGSTINLKPNVLPNVVNKLKYSNYNEFKKFQDERSLKRNDTQTDDDDDCILVEEQNVLGNDKTIIDLTNTNASMKILTSLPPSISVKYGQRANPVKYSNGGTFSLAQVSKPVPALASFTSTSSMGALVPFQSKFAQNQKQEVAKRVDKDRVLNLIKLMLAENKMLQGNSVRIAKSKPNEFCLLGNVYYYRTNDEFEDNYFFMNITRNSRNSKEINQRNYGIFWGNPRRSCVGIVETKGPLDDEAKDFVFQQVKESLFNETTSSTKLLNVSHPIQVDRNGERVISRKPPKSIIKSMKRATNNSTTAVNLDHGHNGQPNEPTLSIPKKCITKVTRQPDALSTSTYPVTKQLTSPSIQAGARPIPIKILRKIPNPKISQKDDRTRSDLIRLSTYLTPAIRKLINKLKYFELIGKVYTVKINEDRLEQDKPYNIDFTENVPGSDFQPVSKQLYVSRLVTYLFNAIYPFIHLDNPNNEPIPIPSPDITSNVSPEVMESIIITESEYTYQKIAKQEAAVNKFIPGRIQCKHICAICSKRFERRYQLKRHQFVEHNLEQVSPSATTTSSAADTLCDIPNITRKAFMKIPMMSDPTELQSKTYVKAEKTDETIDKSLLVPLFDVPESEYTTDFPLVKCKEEPEEHFEEITEIPSLIDDDAPTEPMPQTRKRRAVNSSRTLEDTDSAPESVPDTSRRKIEGTIAAKATGKPKRESVRRLAPTNKRSQKQTKIGSRTIPGKRSVSENPLKL